MYYKNPIYGRAYLSLKRDNFIIIDENNYLNFKFKRMFGLRKQYVIFVDDNGLECNQSLDSIKYIRLRPGEDNFQSKITNKQSIDIYTRANSGESSKSLALEFNISANHVNSIKNLRSRATVTLNHFNEVKPIEKGECVVAKPNKGKKLSKKIAEFIIKDNKILKLSTKVLAKKYCVSQRTIQKIIKGDMYKT